MRRDDACHFVAGLITGERNETHGEAVDQLQHAQQLKTTVGHRHSLKLTLAEMEAIDMICVKLSRLALGKPNEDHWLDIIGYAAIGVEAWGRARCEVEKAVG